jgi:hypothetical protein
MAKRKGKAWGPSNPLWRWQHQKANKVAKRKGSTVTSMAKTTRRYHRRFKSKFKWHRPKRIPLLPAVGFGAGLMFAQTKGGWSSPYEAIQSGDISKVAQAFVSNLTGIGIPMPGQGYSSGPLLINIGGLLNPFDFGEAPALKGLLWGALASKAMGMIGVKRKFDDMTAKIPLLKKVTL